MSTTSATSPAKSLASQSERFPRPEKLYNAHSTMSTSSSPSKPMRIAIPMGFSGQLKALQDVLREQADRIAALEGENIELRESQSNTQALLTRIEILEQHKLHLAARRRECVSQLLTVRPLHQEAANALHLRSQDIQPEDLERMLSVYGTSIMTALNHQQRALGQLRANTYGAPSSGTLYPPLYYPGAPCPPVPIRPPQMFPQFPPSYDEAGYCHIHRVLYRCRVCGQ